MAGHSEGRDPRFDAEALGALDAVYRFAYHLARDPAEAEELVQETYARAYTARRQYAPGSNCTAWLCTICRNVFLRRRERWEREPALEDAELEALAAAAVHIAAESQGVEAGEFERADLREALGEALKKLPEVFRTAVTLVDIEDLTYADAAAVSGVPVGTLRSRLFRGRRLLQQELIEFAVDAGLVRGRPGEAR